MKRTKGFALATIISIIGFGTNLPVVLLTGCRDREARHTVAKSVSVVRGVQSVSMIDKIEPPLHDLKRAPIAQIVGQCRIAPAAGNGLLPIAATVDTRRDRAIVLCQDTRNLTVIDLRGKRLMRVVPLPEYHPDLSSMAVMTYEPRTDTILIAAWENVNGHHADDTTQVITLDAQMLHPVTVSRLQGGGNIASDTALLAVDGATQELFVPRSEVDKDSPRYYLQVLNIRSLRSKRRIGLLGRPVDLIRDSRYHEVVTIEERNPYDNDRRIFARSECTGRVLGSSSRYYENARALAIDAARNCVLFLYCQRRRSCGDIACLVLPSLQEMPDHVAMLRKRLMAELVNDSDHDRDIVDALHRRIYLSSHITDLNYEIKGTMASAEPLPSTLAVSMDGRMLRSVEARLAALWPRGGDALVFYGHALGALDGKTLRERWRVSMGARIQGIMVDRQRHTVLAWGEGDSPDPWLVWAGGTRLRYARACYELLWACGL